MHIRRTNYSFQQHFRNNVCISDNVSKRETWKNWNVFDLFVDSLIEIWWKFLSIRSIIFKIARKYFRFSFVCELYMINLMKFIMIRKQNNAANVLFIKNDVKMKTNCRVMILCSSFVHWVIALNCKKRFNFEKNDIDRNRSFIWNFHFFFIVRRLRFLKLIIDDITIVWHRILNLIFVVTSIHHFKTNNHILEQLM